MGIGTGDVVRHRPTGEEWIVAYVRDDRLAWCGWPEGLASVSDCELVEKATPADRLKLLHEMAAVKEPDSRGRFARRALGWQGEE